MWQNCVQPFLFGGEGESEISGCEREGPSGAIIHKPCVSTLNEKIEM